MSDKLESLVQRLETVANKLERLNVSEGKAVASGDDDEISASVTDFDQYLKDVVEPFVATSKTIGGKLAEIAADVEEGFKKSRDLIFVASKSKKPSQDQLMTFMKPIGEKISSVQDLRNKSRGDKLFNHLSAISEGISCLGWVSVPNTPVSFVKEMLPSSQFYTNKIRVEYKGKDETHLQFVSQWEEVIKQLHPYVKEHHLTGLTWNPRGKDASEVSVSSAPSSSGAPPPPGPPPAPKAPLVSTSSKPAGGDMNAVFDQLKSGALTSGLRKVTKDQKTKYRTDKVSVVPSTVGVKKETTTKKSSFGSSKPKTPKLELLAGKKWNVENYSNNQEIKITETSMNQTVYIYGCDNCLITVEGKVNQITLDGCKKTSVVFESAISSLDFVNCKSCKAQVTKVVPTINIDKTDGCLIYLSEETLSNLSVITSKSSEMNLAVAEKEDVVEHPVPEQFLTLWDPQSRTFKTESTSHV